MALHHVLCSDDRWLALSQMCAWLPLVCIGIPHVASCFLVSAPAGFSCHRAGNGIDEAIKILDGFLSESPQMKKRTCQVYEVSRA